MDEDDGLEPRNTVDILLDHQTQRLEDIANNAVDFIRINLFILGAFMPFLATIITDIISLERLIESRFSKYTVASWLVSTVVATFVYKIARNRSISHFDTLEQAVVNGWRDADLRDEMIDNNDSYDWLTTWLMVGMTVSIAFSLMTILFLGLGISDPLLGFSKEKENTYLVGIIVVSAIAGVGVEFTTGLKTLVFGLFGGINRLLARIAARIQEATPITIQFPLFRIRISNEEMTDSYDYDDYILDMFAARGLSPIRIRLLQAIQEIAGLEAWTFSQLAESLEEKSPDIGVTRGMIQRLLEEGYITHVSPEGPSTIIVHERQQEIINQEDLDKVVGEELGLLIGDIKEKDRVNEIVADELGTTPENVKDVLVEGSTGDRIEKLNAAVERIREELDSEELGYGKIQFRTNANRFRLTPKAIQPFALAQLERGKQAFEEGLLVQASVLASQGLELYLRSMYLRDKQVDREQVLKKGIAGLLDALQKEDVLSEEKIKMLDHLREIRNRAVHSQEAQLEEEEVQELLSIAEQLLNSGLY
jgi:hypothetical protein